MMKINIPDLTIVMTCRIDSPQRRANALAAMAYYRKYTDARLMLLEADSEARLANVIANEFPEVDYIFIEDHNPIFHRTHYINEEMRRVVTTNSANIDVDTIVPPHQLEAANNLLRNGDDRQVMVIPYDGRFICAGACRSDLFRSRIDLRILDSMPGPVQLMFGYISVGGAYVVNVDRYRRCGWENENFTGWGPEDYERFIRLDILGCRPVQLPGVIYHLDHPRGVNSGDRVAEVVLATKREYAKISAMFPAELRSYISGWNWAN